ncbi:MAG: YebC/PmpR family DNA-binding transcriptional regulator [Rickettsiales bacterium]
MAGHSQFKNIMYRKGAQDAKRGKLFTKIGREIISACKVGNPDPASNPRLRSAISWARSENMPRDRIEAAIKRGSGDVDTDNFESVRYEGYGVGGIAIIVEALTDNRNRTAPDIRAAFSKFGGTMGESGSVSFMFDYIGRIVYKAEIATQDGMFEAAIEVGADNCEFDDNTHIISCALEQFGQVRDGLENRFGEPESAKMIWQPKNTVSVDEEQARTLLKMIDLLDDNDDVQEVFSNFEISDDILQRIND